MNDGLHTNILNVKVGECVCFFPLKSVTAESIQMKFGVNLDYPVMYILMPFFKFTVRFLAGVFTVQILHYLMFVDQLIVVDIVNSKKIVIIDLKIARLIYRCDAINKETCLSV